MPVANHLRQVFPSEWATIKKARSTDIRLDEICSDFENLSMDLERADQRPGVMSDGLKADYAKSLEALRSEILDWLERIGRNTN